MNDLLHINEEEILRAIAAEPLLAGLSPDQRSQFLRLVDMLMEGQSRMNLTAIRSPVAMVRYHLADSVALKEAVEKFPVSGGVARAADVGTGGGFPLLPMAILWPQTDWVGIESVSKKANFVEQTGDKLGLQNISAVAARAEDVCKTDERASFDLVTSRAVGPVASLLEVEMPLLKRGGSIYLMKTEATRPEWAACGELLNRLGATTIGEFEYRLEGDEQARVIFVAEKVRETPDTFPRSAGVPFKKPLVKWSGVEGSR